MTQVDLNKFNNNWYKPGSYSKRIVWYFINISFFKNYFFPFSGFKTFILKLFGGKVGKNLVIKPNVNIKYPWFLEIGDNVSIGEGVWIDNLDMVILGDNVCISQGAYLLTGNHNYKLKSFDLITKRIIIESGVWIGAKSIVCPGVTCKSHSILSVNSVATSDLEKFSIYQGNPAQKKSNRKIYNG